MENLTTVIQETKETFNFQENNFLQETYENGVLIESEKDNKDNKFKNNFLDKKALKFFRSLGGKEKVSQTSKFGIGCTLSTSISPDGNTKKLTYFFY